MKKYLPVLRNSSFFKGLTDEEILSILHCVEATAVSKERDSYIFRAADSTEVMGLWCQVVFLLFRKTCGDIEIFYQNAMPAISLENRMQQARGLF